MENIAWLGQALFSLVFIMSGIGHLTKTNDMAGYAAHKGIPSPKLAVQVSGLVLLVGGVLLLANTSAQLGALLIAGFCIVTAVLMHQFWKETDATAKMNETIAFFKDLSLAGAALIIYAVLHAGASFGPHVGTLLAFKK